MRVVRPPGGALDCCCGGHILVCVNTTIGSSGSKNLEKLKRFSVLF